jgi:TMEM175 potassium channel family protein
MTAASPPASSDAEPAPDDDAAAARTYARGSFEFERVAFFCDAVYAISLTLLVTSLDVPDIVRKTEASDLWSALGDVRSRIITFFVSFVVIGNFWVAHHRFVSTLRAVSRPLIYVTMLYLGFVAFLPFPSAVLGAYSDNPVGVSFYAVSIALVSGMEGVTFSVAWRQSLLRYPLSRSAFQWAMTATLVPVAMFLVSIPIAFASPVLGIVTWLVTFPIEAVLERFRPAELAND